MQKEITSNVEIEKANTLRGIMLGDYTLRGIMLGDCTLRGIILGN